MLRLGVKANRIKMNARLWIKLEKNRKIKMSKKKLKKSSGNYPFKRIRQNNFC
jgi:hypothetical protein